MKVAMTTMIVPRRPRHNSRSYWSPNATPAKRSLLQMMLKAMRSLRMRQARIQVMDLTSIRTRALFLRRMGVKVRLPGRKSPQRHHPMSAPAPALILMRMRMRKRKRMNYQAYQNTKQSRLQVQTPARAKIRILIRIVSLQRRTN